MNDDGQPARANSASDSRSIRRDFLVDAPDDHPSASPGHDDQLIAWAQNHRPGDGGSTSNPRTLTQPAGEARFDAASRSLASGRTRRGVLASLAGGLLAAIGVRSGASASHDQSLVTVCYRDVTLTVPEPAASVLLTQGATPGACPDVSGIVCYRGITLTVSDVAARYLLELGATAGPCFDGGVGEPGPQGPQGPQGSQGSQGPQGLIGMSEASRTTRR